MLLTMFLTCFVALAFATGLLLLLGHRIRRASAPLAVLFALVWAIGSGELAARLWSLPSGYVEIGEIVLMLFIGLMVVVRPVWNPVGQVFFGCYLAAVVTYLAAAFAITFNGSLPLATAIASAMLLLLEIVALTLGSTFAFESCDVICRTRWTRLIQPPDPEYFPKVSLQIAAYNEPPDMLIETIASAERIDYPNFEVVVIDNNTKDPAVWKPVEEYCRDRERVRFIHVDPWPGYKSGALNLALTDYTAPDAELVGVIDADYIVDPSYLRSVVGYFADPNIGFVQTPQDYREYEGDAYLEACYDAYKYFFVTSMPSRNERNSIIFAGTMGLLRRSALERLGGWDEWCITEDAETSLRMLKMGYSGLFLPTPFGHGIMPLTFTSLKSQRFRWCFGGMQILRSHWRELMPWDRDPENRLSIAQRFDYLISGLQWLNDLVNLLFSLVLMAMAAVFLTKGEVTLRPLFGVALLLPAALMASGLLRALWALRRQTGISTRRALRAFANWLSLSFTVAIACLQGLVRSEGVFMRTPKFSEGRHLLSALWAAKTEGLITACLWGAGIVLALTGRGNVFVVMLFAWQGLIYASSVWMSWLNQHTELSAQLQRRQRTERRRERIAGLRPYYVGGFVGGAIAATVTALVLIGGSQPNTGADPFALPKAAPNDRSPVQNVVGGQPAPAETPTGGTTGAGFTTETTDTTATTDTVPDSSTSTSTTAPGSTTTTAPGSTTTAPSTTATTAPTTTSPTTTAPTTTTTAPPAGP